MRDYELTVILNPDLDEAGRGELLQKVEGLLTGGQEDAEKPVAQHWGQMNLSYPIKDFTYGYYVLYDTKVDPTRIRDIEQSIIYSEDILRHLMIRKA